MKKILAAILSIIMVFSCFGFAYAEETTAPAASKTEAFINSMQSGVGAKANISFQPLVFDGEMFVRQDKAVANVNIGPIKAKAIIDGDSFMGYFGIFSVDISQFISKNDINNVKGVINEIPNALKDIADEDYFEYLILTEAVTKDDGKFVEKFGPNYQKIAEKIREENPELTEEDVQDIKAFCEYYAEQDVAISALLRSSAEFTYENDKADTLIDAVISVPNQNNQIEVIRIFDVISKEIGGNIDYIKVNFSDDVFKKPFSILNITWLIKLIIKFA